MSAHASTIVKDFGKAQFSKWFGGKGHTQRLKRLFFVLVFFVVFGVAL